MYRSCIAEKAAKYCPPEKADTVLKDYIRTKVTDRLQMNPDKNECAGYVNFPDCIKPTKESPHFFYFWTKATVAILIVAIVSLYVLIWFYENNPATRSLPDDSDDSYDTYDFSYDWDWDNRLSYAVVFIKSSAANIFDSSLHLPGSHLFILSDYFHILIFLLYL